MDGAEAEVGDPGDRRVEAADLGIDVGAVRGIPPSRQQAAHHVPGLQAHGGRWAGEERGGGGQDEDGGQRPAVRDEAARGHYPAPGTAYTT
jgi:hypothetical protein